MSSLDSYLVIKLGGTSQTKFGYENLLNKITEYNKYKIVIVVSAIKGITNNLINYTKDKNTNFIHSFLDKNYVLCDDLKVNREVVDKNNPFLFQFMTNNFSSLQDKINFITTGETSTANILNNFLKKNKIKSIYMDSIDIIDSNLNNDFDNIFNKGEFKIKENYLLYNLFKNNDVIVIPGFRGKTPNNKMCLMGRGGSDTTGSIISASLKAKEYMIWTDVNGIFSGDPNIIKHVNIIPTISYNAAQEISAMGAKVIHPFCIKPCMKANIPISIRNTYDLNSKYTIIENCLGGSEKAIYSITNQSNIVVFKIKSLNMWNNYGFVFHIFTKFKDYNVDVNIINTSQFDITTTTNDTNIKKLERLKKELEKDYNVDIIYNCSCISLVGENIRKYDKLNKIINALKNYDIKLTSYSSNDMSISFVVKNDIYIDILQKIHKIAFPYYYFENKNKWWNQLLNLNAPDKCKYFYSLDNISKKIYNLKNLHSINNIFYAMKANNSKDIILHMLKNNLGIETVSIEEIDLVKQICINNNIRFETVNILFTPNFVSIQDYVDVINENNDNIIIIIDNIEILKTNGNIFKNKIIGLRLDLDYGFGHCDKVVTQGIESKFGMSFNDIINNIDVFIQNNIVIGGLHSHMGSGITDFQHWVNNYKLLIKIFEKIPNEINNIKWIDIGGGFGINNSIDFKSLDNQLLILKNKYNLKIYIEPGRYLVAESGIILGKVTQIKYKNKTKFIGTNIGMTDLLRPALYSAIHPIYFKDTNSPKELVTIVGPICESSDVLLRNLLVDNSIKIGDSVIVENVGAYGFVMISNYNNRELPEELLLKY